MRYKYLLLIIIALATGLTACKKESNKYPIVGKWQQTKLRLYQLNSTGTILYDTTYLRPFTSLDFVQFNNNNTGTESTDHYYYPNQPGQPKTPQLIPATVAKWNFTVVGSQYVLSAPGNLINPGGFDVRDTVYLPDPNTLLIHQVFYSRTGVFKSISDAYYTK